MLLNRKQFKQIMDLKDVKWDEIEEHVKQACIVKCNHVLDKLPSITAIEGVSNVLGAKFMIEQRVVDTLETLGQSISDAKRDELLVSRFLDGDQFPVAVKVAPTIVY